MFEITLWNLKVLLISLKEHIFVK